MDLSKFAARETSTLTLLGADERPLIGEDKQPMTVTVYGPGSSAYARAQAANQNRMIDKLKGKGKTEQSAEDKARETAEFLTACTAAFSANIEYKGLAGQDLYRGVYSDPALGFIAEQVGKHVGNWANFAPESAAAA